MSTDKKIKPFEDLIDEIKKESPLREEYIRQVKVLAVLYSLAKNDINTGLNEDVIIAMCEAFDLYVNFLEKENSMQRNGKLSGRVRK